jgi:segregation and condensation protein B
LRTLLEKNLVTIKGRDEGMGRPLLYATTPVFLEAFGLNRLGDLPKMKEIDEILADGEKPSMVEYEVE